MPFLCPPPTFDHVFKITIGLDEGGIDKIIGFLHLILEPTSKLVLDDIIHSFVRENVHGQHEQKDLAHFDDPIHYALALLALLF